ncbi:MAG: GatB/YqeY domain-containing protein [Candidatus Neomarinimicrobiota bacterium]|nr:GatB/YqeY domain-containing protein [Candidatus Neomarinimicrobiota bacterium]
MLSLLQNKLIEAMKNKDKPTIMGIRNIIGKIKAKKIDKGADLTDEECLQILNSSAKQLKESISQYEKAERNDLADVEKFELSILKKFLPKQLSNEKIRLIVKTNIEKINAKSIQDMGRVMGMVMKDVMGAADGKIVKEIVQEELS